MPLFSLKFILGIILLLTNNIIGWAGVIGSAYLARRTGRRMYYAAGTAVYGVSWLMLVTGLLLAGPEGIEFVRSTSNHPLLKAFLILVAAGALLYAWLGTKKKIPKTVIPAETEAA